MKCPYCNEEMKLGVIHGERFALKWVNKDNDNLGILHPFKKGIKLSNPYDFNVVEAYLCNDCKKIIIDLPK